MNNDKSFIDNQEVTQTPPRWKLSWCSTARIRRGEEMEKWETPGSIMLWLWYLMLTGSVVESENKQDIFDPIEKVGFHWL